MNTIYFWVGLVIVNSILGALWLLTGWIGKGLMQRLTRIYHMTVILYWLKRLEKEGRHTFQRARNEVQK